MDHAEGTATGGDAASPGRRERQIGEREREADEREVQLRQHAEELRDRAASARGQSAQAVEQAETLLNANQDRARRAEAVLNRAYLSAARDRTSAARSARRGELHAAPRQRDFTALVDRVSALRKRTAAAAAQFARTEEYTARVHDELATRDPGNPEYRRLAVEAREAARWAREIERKYSSS